jgi:hypothetical protein
MDVEDVKEWYEVTELSGEELTPTLMTGLFGDALLGYMRREDLVGKEDEEAMRWASQMVKEVKGGVPFVSLLDTCCMQP